ncbi:HAMP domain-containing histidine kinase [Streptomyces phaeochromogenes]|uniref:histidine kinase n=1 Tax=Streptomyces phaeochromogenes TaxID=1923 RepID=A0ABZ1H6J1_STRPH|nr:HAMP domain-containing sensor histidine kinase [Streptomyces phaeochromogenes]WSD13794.1 HAMP domain-containing histidine kinase [Streptomyces phaeochromogenes]
MKLIPRSLFRLRRLRPATLRMRLALLAAVIAVVPLAAAAAGVALAAQGAIMQQARQHGAEDELWFPVNWDGKRLLHDSKPVPECRSTSPMPLNGQQVSFCKYLYDLSLDAPSLPGKPRVFDSLKSQGDLSLKPWTDPTNGPTPVRTPTTYKTLDGYVVLIYSAEAAQARLNTIGWSVIGGALALTLLIAGSTWIAAGRVLRPVEAIRAEFAEFTAHHLDRRVTVPRTGNEIARLASTMNTTLDQLQTTIENQRQFVADASHELRTPLACLRTELELADNRPDTADWPQVVHDALGDAIRLQNLTSDLLLLARLDAEHTDQQPDQHIDLTHLVREETARRHLPDHLTLHVHITPAPVTVTGRRALLARVLGNLLDNAERHANSSLTIRLTHGTEHHVAVLDVLDDGPGIPPEHHQRIFERFTRLDDARARDTGGAGLGLAIAHRITTTHHGTLEITPSTRGAHFTLRLPTPCPDTVQDGCAGLPARIPRTPLPEPGRANSRTNPPPAARPRTQAGEEPHAP